MDVRILALILWGLIVVIVIGRLSIKADMEDRFKFFIVGLISILILIRNLCTPL